MNTSKELAAACLRAFEQWMQEEFKGAEMRVHLVRLLRAAFVAGYQKGGKKGAEIMGAEALKIMAREATR